jgi:hypothetical protein
MLANVRVFKPVSSKRCFIVLDFLIAVNTVVMICNPTVYAVLSLQHAMFDLQTRRLRGGQEFATLLLAHIQIIATTLSRQRDCVSEVSKCVTTLLLYVLNLTHALLDLQAESMEKFQTLLCRMERKWT